MPPMPCLVLSFFFFFLICYQSINCVTIISKSLWWAFNILHISSFILCNSVSTSVYNREWLDNYYMNWPLVWSNNVFRMSLLLVVLFPSRCSLTILNKYSKPVRYYCHHVPYSRMDIIFLDRLLSTIERLINKF